MSKTNQPLSNVTDGYCISQVTTNWAGARDASAGTGVTNNSQAVGIAIAVAKGTNRSGADQWTIQRTFLAFDTSQISSSFSVFSAQLQLNNNSGSYPNADVILVKSNKPDLSTGLAAADFDDLPGFSTGNTMDGNVTDYSSVFASGSWPTNDQSGLNIDLNAAAITDIKSGDVLSIAIINYNYDYKNIEPSAGHSEGSGIYFAETSVGGNKPNLTIKYGFNHRVLGVDHRFMAKLVGVADEKIKKVFSKASP